MAKKKQIAKNILFWLTAFLLVKCANQLPPGGGEVDKIPPEIIATYPENGSTDFNDDYISFTFSEYVDKRSVKEAIFISPTIEGEIEYDWSGRTLDLEFEEPLQKNSTYTVTIGADIKDINNGNTMPEAFTLLFSTGAKLDSGIIAGRIYDDNPLGVFVFAYKSDTSEVNIYESKPDYVSQVGETGAFELKGLAPADYKVIAVRDQFGDLIYNKEEDYYGVPFLSATLTEKKYLISGVDFFLTKEDTTAPMIFSATMTDRIHILLEFSEFVDSSLLDKNNFFVYDSTSGRSVEAAFSFKGKTKPKEYYLSLSDTLNAENANYLVVIKLVDLYGNETRNESVMLTVNEEPDTLKPKIEKITAGSDDKIDLIKPVVTIFFNDGVKLLDAKRGVKFFDKDSSLLPVELNYLDDAAIETHPKVRLKSNETYYLSVDTKYFEDAAGNRGDTVVVKIMNSKNELDYTGISGRVITSDSAAVIVALKSVEQKKAGKSFYRPINKKGKFEFDKLQPGKYRIWAFYDVNGNGKYDYGKLQPFVLSERFKFYLDTLNVRPRWPIGDVIINFN